MVTFTLRIPYPPQQYGRRFQELRAVLASFNPQDGRMSLTGFARRPQLSMHTSELAGGRLNSLEGLYLQTVRYTK